MGRAVTRYAISLGSNVGDRLQHLVDACSELSEQVGDLEVSHLYETAPVGGPDQDPFLNAAAVVESDLAPDEMLDVCQEIERRHGRERTTRWGPRTLDLDIIATDGQSVSTNRLTIPHPRASERRFVLRPMIDIWPGAPVSPELTASDALARVDDQDVDHLTGDWLAPTSRWKAHALLTGQFVVIVAVALALGYDGSIPDDEMTVVRVLGGTVALVGVALAFSASRRLAGSMTASPLPRPDAELVMSGPYRFARHPIYGGLSLFLMGTSLFLDSILAFMVAALLIPYFLLKARYEEAQLRMRFPRYRLYKQTVRRWLIPFVI